MFKTLKLFVAVAIVYAVGCGQPENSTPPSIAKSNTDPPTSMPDQEEEMAKNRAIAENQESAESPGSAGAGPPRGEGFAIAANALALGSAAYKKGMCNKCHGENGSGTPRGPDLTDSTWIHCENSPGDIHRVLLSGIPKSELHDKSRPHAMNPATNLISDASELVALTKYVYSLQNNQP